MVQVHVSLCKEQVHVSTLCKEQVYVSTLCITIGLIQNLSYSR